MLCGLNSNLNTDGTAWIGRGGGAKKIKFRNMAQFPRFFLGHTEAHNSMPISQEMAFLGF
jgi:hypothetical protein